MAESSENNTPQSDLERVKTSLNEVESLINKGEYEEAEQMIHSIGNDVFQLGNEDDKNQLRALQTRINSLREQNQEPE